MKKVLYEKVVTTTQKYINTHGLLNSGERLLIGVSGGPDSVALLDILFRLRHTYGIEIGIAHFNHNLRESAERDQKFTLKLAEKYHIPFHTKTWKHPPKQAPEEKAREVRLNFFKQTKNKYHYNKVALAHTENDVAETFLMRIIRGSGLQGMQSILPKRTINELVIIRPLLSIRKHQLLEYIKKSQLKYRNDPTNKQNDFTRNKIRNTLIPELTKSYNPNIITTLANASFHIASDYNFLIHTTEKIFNDITKPKPVKNEIQFSLQKFCNQHTAIQKLLIRIAFKKLSGNLNQLTSQHWLEIHDLINNRPNGSIVHLPKSLLAKKSAQALTFEKVPGTR